METSIREMLLSFADVIMRVPPLFIIDEILKIDLSLPNSTVILNNPENGFQITNIPGTIVFSISSDTKKSFLIEQVDLNYFPYMAYVIVIFKFLCCCLGE